MRFVHFLLRAAAAAVLITGTVAAQPANGGNGTIYYATYAKKILVIDEATMAVKDSMQSSIGIPFGLTLSGDRQHIYITEPTRQWVEVFDIKTRRAISKFTLSDDNREVRISGFTVDPKERFAVLLVKTAAKKSDRWEIGKPTLLKYDFAKKMVTDTIKWPDGEEREFAQIILSPDGNLMYFFTAEDILIYDAQTLKQVDRWDLQRSVDDGLGRWNFGFPESLYEEPGFFTGLFRSTDPVNNRTLMGVARVDLLKKSVDFYSLGPSDGVGFTLAPGRQRAYGLKQQVGNYQFWMYDLANRRVAQRVEFEGRPRMGLDVSTNGRILYVHTAGPTVDLWDAETLRFIRQVEYRADMTDFLVVP